MTPLPTRGGTTSTSGRARRAARLVRLAGVVEAGPEAPEGAAPPVRTRALRRRSVSSLALQVVVHQLGHLEHRDGPLAAEDLAEGVVRVDVALLLLVLQAVPLHV